MFHAVISTDGHLHLNREGDPMAAVGPEGPARVQLPNTGLTGWVNDCGLLFPDRYPRNIVGSVLLAAHRAVERPYAGPVVITGQHLCPWHGVETCDLSEAQMGNLAVVHRDVRLALEGRPTVTPGMSAEWGEQVRELAEQLRTAPTPGLRVRRAEWPGGR